MEWLVVISFVFFGYLMLSKIKNKIQLFLQSYEIFLVDKEDVEREGTNSNDILQLRPESYDNSIDLRGTPTHLCPCGSQIWNLKVIFEDFEIATYFLDMECVSCGSVATAPTPVDREEME
jgi:hypothetical protein